MTYKQKMKLLKKQDPITHYEITSDPTNGDSIDYFMLLTWVGFILLVIAFSIMLVF